MAEEDLFAAPGEPHDPPPDIDDAPPPPWEQPPPPDWDDFPASEPGTPPGRPQGRAEANAEHAHDVAQDCLAACQGGTGDELLDMCNSILAAEVVTDLWEPSRRRLWRRTIEVLRSIYGDFGTDTVNFADLPELEEAPRTVQRLVAQIAGRTDVPTNPFAAWAALCDRLRIEASAEAAANYAALAGSDAAVEEMLAAWRDIPAPASATEESRTTHTRTAEQWETAAVEAAATAPTGRWSFGLPSLDYALTAQHGDGTFAEPLGSVADGEFFVVAAPTGNGKSAMARPMAAGLAQDLRNAGRRDDKVLICITEESPTIVYKAAGLGTGQSRHHLADQVVIANCGASRVRIVHAVWSLVVDAFEKSKASGRPITECGLPRFVLWDYIGGTAEAGEAGDTVAMERNANLALRGFAGWNVDDMETFSGQRFAEFAGMPWPTGMEMWRPAVIAFAQFVKLKEPTWWDPDNPKCNRADFVVDNIDGTEAWPLRAGDFRVPAQTEVRGSGVLINHATTLMFLHRSRPARNPKIVDQATGRVRLADDRARVLLIKTRNGATTPVVSMRFDSNPEGLRGQWYDPLEKVLVSSGVPLADGYTGDGDPLLPPRAGSRSADLVLY